MMMCLSVDEGRVGGGAQQRGMAGKKNFLGGGFKYFLFSPLFGEDEPILTIIFVQRGWLKPPTSLPLQVSWCFIFHYLFYAYIIYIYIFTYYIHIEFIWDSIYDHVCFSNFPGMIWVQLLRRDLLCFLRSTPRIAFLQVVPLKYFKHQPNVRKYPNPNWYHIELIQQWQVWSSCNVLCILGTWSPAGLCNMKSKKSLQGMNVGSYGLCVLKWTV